MEILFKLLHPSAKLPARGHGIDVGLDVFTPTEGVLRPGPNKIPLGFGMSVPIGYSANIYPRTGMASGEKTLDLEVVQKTASKTGGEPTLTVRDVASNGIAILAQMPPIDPGYTGEVNAIVLNVSDLYIRYPAGTRFGQLVFHPIAYAIPTLSVDLSRGDKGFGSTGI